MTESFLERAARAGHVRFEGPEDAQRITYLPTGKTQRYGNPEEKVRAEFWAELILRYGYPPNRVGIEVTVPDRTPRDAADLVVFHDDKCTRPYAVIECKRDGITDSEFAQAIEQAAGNGTWAKLRASYIGVVAGSTRRFLDFSGKFGVLEREANIVADLPVQYGKPEQFKFHRGGDVDISPVSKEELINAIRKCHQTLWGGGKLSPPMAFGELCKIIFVKISDEVANRKPGEPYQFQIKTHEPTHKLAERIRTLYAEQRAKDPEVFADTINIDDASIRTVVSHLEGIDLSRTDLDTKGIAFEQFMDSFFKGDFGQYFTPREVIDFAVGMLDPVNSDLILDPACGSGGFLLYALDKVRHDADDYHEPGTIAHYRFWHDFAQNHLYGIEINEEIARVAKMNMIIHDDGHSNVVCADALDRISRLYDRNRGFREKRFDLVLTNPPFGAKVMASERPYVDDYDLGRRRSQKTEILFIERVWAFLKPATGKAAIVLPDGILTNASLQYVRDFIVERFQILAIVSLPDTAFFHYGAGVKASLMFLRRRGEDESVDPNESVFMAQPEQIGYDATGRKCRNDLPEVLSEYRAFVKDPQQFEV